MSREAKPDVKAVDAKDVQPVAPVQADPDPDFIHRTISLMSSRELSVYSFAQLQKLFNFHTPEELEALHILYNKKGNLNLLDKASQALKQKILIPAQLKQFLDPNAQLSLEFLLNHPEFQVQFRDDGIVVFNEFHFNHQEIQVIFRLQSNYRNEIHFIVLKFLFTQLHQYRQKPNYNFLEALQQLIRLPPVNLCYTQYNDGALYPVYDSSSTNTTRFEFAAHLKISGVFNALLNKTIQWEDIANVKPEHLTEALHTTPAVDFSKKETWLQIIETAKVLQFLSDKKMMKTDYTLRDSHFIFRNQLRFNSQQLLSIINELQLNDDPTKYRKVPLTVVYFILYYITYCQQPQHFTDTELKQFDNNQIFKQAFERTKLFLKNNYPHLDSSPYNIKVACFITARPVNMRMIGALANQLINNSQWWSISNFLINENIANHLFPESNQPIIHEKYLNVLIWISFEIVGHRLIATDENAKEALKIAIAEKMIAWFPLKKSISPPDPKTAVATISTPEVTNRSVFVSAWDSHQDDDNTRTEVLYDALRFDLAQIDSNLASQLSLDYGDPKQEDLIARYKDPLPMLNKAANKFLNRFLLLRFSIKPPSYNFYYADAVLKIRYIEIFAFLTSPPAETQTNAAAKAGASAGVGASAAAAAGAGAGATTNSKSHFIPAPLHGIVIAYCLWHRQRELKPLENLDEKDDSTNTSVALAQPRPAAGAAAAGAAAAGAAALAISKTDVKAQHPPKPVNYFSVALRFFNPKSDIMKDPLTFQTSTLIAFIQGIAAKRAALEGEGKIGDFNNILNTCTNFLEKLRACLDQLCNVGIVHLNTLQETNRAMLRAYSILGISEIKIATKTFTDFDISLFNIIGLYQELEIFYAYRTTAAYQQLPVVIQHGVDGALGEEMPQLHYFAPGR